VTHVSLKPYVVGSQRMAQMLAVDAPLFRAKL
jgi:hypothetical protein